MSEALWRKSSFSESHSACVEIAPILGGFAVRDSKDPNGPALQPIVKGWTAFIGRVSAGELSLPS